MAVLALRREGEGEHPRVREGIRLIADRAIAGGGWNYGNRAVFGRDLRPQPAPTGLALLAIREAKAAGMTATRGLDYLRRELPTIRSAASLGWGLLALRAWDAGPSEADAWLAEAAGRVIDRPDAATKLAFLLLASGATSPTLVGSRLGEEARRVG